MKIADINDLLLVWGPLSKEGISQIKEEANLVLIPENRPYLIGLKYNIPLLKKEGVRFIYATDNMLGFLFYKNKIKKTLLFYKELKPQGLIGICGSLYIALLTKLHQIPIKIYPAEKFISKGLDQDASSLDGKNFILDKDKNNFVVSADDELVGWEILR
ncbi:MAG: hypothetical protein NC912_04180 [Candidatus Omnitrophica bacterium]|nr:hypothetical protein [Candidatus Omnitrophota bacterium]